MSPNQRLSFAFCKCFLTQNVYLPKVALYVDYFDDDAKFRKDYEELIPKVNRNRYDNSHTRAGKFLFGGWGIFYLSIF